MKEKRNKEERKIDIRSSQFKTVITFDRNSDWDVLHGDIKLTMRSTELTTYVIMAVFGLKNLVLTLKIELEVFRSIFSVLFWDFFLEIILIFKLLHKIYIVKKLFSLDK
jgi:hypothetical protein